MQTKDADQKIKIKNVKNAYGITVFAYLKFKIQNTKYKIP
jgi:hypothetical protein